MKGEQLPLFGQLSLFAGAGSSTPAPRAGDWFARKCPRCGHRIGLHSGPDATASRPGSCHESGCGCPGWRYWEGGEQ